MLRDRIISFAEKCDFAEKLDMIRVTRGLTIYLDFKILFCIV